MSRADGTPEASIEDILASIRKNFTEDKPAATAAPASASATDAVPRSAGLPSFRSATEVASQATATSVPTPPRSRAAAIDDDLDDLIDKPVSPAPEAKRPAAPPRSPVEAAREKWAHLLNPGGAGNGVKSPETPALTTEPVALPSSPSPAPAAPAAPSLTGLFAPRKSGFYPPSEPRPEPVLPLPPAATAPAAETLVGKALEETTSVAPKPGFIPTVTPPGPGPAETAASPVPTSTSGHGSPDADRAPEPQAVPPPAEVPAASTRALDDLVAGLNSVAQPAEPVVPVKAPAQTAPAPAGPAVVPQATSATGAAPVPPAAAIGSASPTAVPASVNAIETAAAQPPAGRTLEDVVADMLRPLLEKWIDENMPRIVERALQRDATLGRHSS
jgi:cell pole-organizing protein PopZ